MVLWWYPFIDDGIIDTDTSSDGIHWRYWRIDSDTPLFIYLPTLLFPFIVYCYIDYIIDWPHCVHCYSLSNDNDDNDDDDNDNDNDIDNSNIFLLVIIFYNGNDNDNDIIRNEKWQW